VGSQTIRATICHGPWVDVSPSSLPKVWHGRQGTNKRLAAGMLSGSCSPATCVEFYSGRLSPVSALPGTCDHRRAMTGTGGGPGSGYIGGFRRCPFFEEHNWTHNTLPGTQFMRSSTFTRSSNQTLECIHNLVTDQSNQYKLFPSSSETSVLLVSSIIASTLTVPFLNT
jgi:hypothetical protein